MPRATTRATWKGFLKVAELTCPVALHAATSTSERIAFNTLNRKTGHRVRRQFVDQETGAPVERDDQVKGYEVGSGDHVMLEPEEIAAAIPESDKTLQVSAFVALGEVDDLYLDKPYFLTPADKGGERAFALVREGLARAKVAAIARAVLFRRARAVLIRPEGRGLMATTLHFDHEVRSASEAFESIPEFKAEGEMLALAEHIIGTRSGTFDPAAFQDRYETALADLVRAKMEGRTIAAPKARTMGKVIDLMSALRESAGLAGGSPAPKKKAAKGTAKGVAKSPAKDGKPGKAGGAVKASGTRRKTG